jgi:hypothetical protein
LSWYLELQIVARDAHGNRAVEGAAGGGAAFEVSRVLTLTLTLALTLPLPLPLPLAFALTLALPLPLPLPLALALAFEVSRVQIEL